MESATAEVDKRYGGFFNATLEEYPLSVNADIGEIEVDFIDKTDPLLNRLGVKGSGQAGAISHGIARALIKYDPDFRPALKKAGLLTRDPRMKERKKYGLKRARKAPQYTKR